MPFDIKLTDITVARTARYALSGKPSEQIRKLWIVFHGYGELAAEFLKKISILDEPGTLFLAPEGLSRFYTRGGRGEIGASWMTKEAREDEIADYIKFINDVSADVLKICEKVEEINILGFSQGAATACRWFGSTDLDVKRLILWGAVFPTDMKISFDKKSKTEMILFAGNADKFLDPKTVEDASGNFDRVISYEGEHAILAEVLKTELRL